MKQISSHTLAAVLTLGSVIGTLYAAPASAADSAIDHYLLGLQLAEDGKVDSAIVELSAASALDTLAAEIPRELARMLVEARGGGCRRRAGREARPR